MSKSAKHMFSEAISVYSSGIDVQLNSLQASIQSLPDFFLRIDNFGDYPVSLGESRAGGVEVESAKVLSRVFEK